MLCLVAGGVMAMLPAEAFTLAWDHTVERIEWQEDYRVTPEGLVLVEARVQGSGAGMEPPDGARLEGGLWRWRPGLPPLPELVLARSEGRAWRLCVQPGACRFLDAVIPGDGPVAATPCR